jgi:hypothetical protein
LHLRIAKKRPLRQGFVCQPSAAGFFPRQLFIEDNDFATCTGQFRRAQCPRWPATDYRDALKNWHESDTSTAFCV